MTQSEAGVQNEQTGPRIGAILPSREFLVTRSTWTRSCSRAPLWAPVVEDAARRDFGCNISLPAVGHLGDPLMLELQRQQDHQCAAAA